MAEEIKKILGFRNIAIVGLSKDPVKESHKVALYLKMHGYRVIPVNPTVSSILGEVSHQGLLRIPAEIAGSIETILVFRPGEEALKILLDVLKLQEAFGSVKAIWLQKGIKSAKTGDFARKSGLLFVQDKCIMAEHKKSGKKH